MKMECNECSGAGNFFEPCSWCHGKGKLPDGMPCDECNESGEEEVTCEECDGSGEVEDEDEDDE